MTSASNIDATIALIMIILLMSSLIGMNAGYIAKSNLLKESIIGYYPISNFLIPYISAENAHFVYELNWWMHIGLVFLFLKMN